MLSKSSGCRNGYSTKTVITDDNNTIEVQVPRDRNSTFEPVIIPKHEKRTLLFNDQIISMYLAIKNASTRWTMSIKDWGLAVNQFAILFDGRVPGFN